MNKLFPILLLVLFSLSTAPIVQTITELTAAVFDDFAAPGWQASFFGGATCCAVSGGCWYWQNPNCYTYTCNGQSVFGGYQHAGAGAFASKIYNTPTAHQFIELSLRIYLIDSWDLEHYFIWSGLENKLLYQARGLNWYVMTYKTYIIKYPNGYWCGGGWLDSYVDVVIKFPHTASQYQLKLTSGLNQDSSDESLGWRNIKINTYNCDPTCSSCFGPGPLDCYACASGLTYFKTQCVNSAAISAVAPYTAVTLNELFGYFTQWSLSGWYCSGYGFTANNYITPCESQNVLGGYKLYSKGSNCDKTYTATSHYKLQVKANVLWLDSMDDCLDTCTGEQLLSDDLIFYIDGVQTYREKPLNTLIQEGRRQTNNLARHICGSAAWMDYYNVAVFEATHTATTFKFKFGNDIGYRHGTTIDEYLGLSMLDILAFQCDTSCLTCFAGGVNGCTSCKAGATLIGSTCVICDAKCVACKSATTCTNCKSPYLFYALTQQCMDKCPDGTWGNTATLTCDACPANCLTCFGGNTNQCNSCTTGYGLIQNTCINNANIIWISYEA